ncbi:ABC transporter ATP-binding protein [Nonomuraea fuscirosea]
MSPVIVEGLRKSYGAVKAVDDVSFTVARGEVFALLGPNGAGKTTTVEILEGHRGRDGGQVSVLGFDPATGGRAYREHIGIVLQEAGFEDEFSVAELVRLYAGFYPRPRDPYEVIEQVGLQDKRDARVGTLSGGQRRRLDIALGLIHRPDLLFLDEPSTGLDPKSRAEIWEHILRLRATYGTTLFLTTHYLEEADNMAERVVIIDGGRIIADGTAEQLKNDLAGDHIVITTATEREAARAAEIGGGGADGVTVRLRVAGATATLPDYLRGLDAAGIKVKTAETIRPTLDDVFLTLTGRSLTDDDIPA